MKIPILCIYIWFIPMVFGLSNTQAQSTTYQHATDIINDFSLINQTLAKEANYWKKQLNDKRLNINLLYKLFRRTQARWLRSYTSYAQWQDLIERRQFDCITGSMFYAYLLGQLGIPYDILEAKYHVFIQLKLNEKLVVLETTSKNGFLEFTDAIEKHHRVYASEGELRYIGFVELFALYYYNQAVAAYNQGLWGVAAVQLSKAQLLYRSPRFIELQQHLQAHLSSFAGLF